MSAKKPLEPGERVVRFINKLSHTGDFSGQPFCLRPWQESFVRKLFGTVRADGTRQYKRSFLALPRKSGKTELGAAILLYMLLGTGRRGQHLYSAAGDHAQASLIFRAMATMIRNDATLDACCVVYDGYKRIECRPLDSFYESLSSDAPRKHGLGPSVVLFDEVHVLPNRELHDVLTTGFGARKDPLTLYITTAGHDRHSLCYELWEYAQRVRDGEIDDPSFLPVIYAADPGDDWTAESTWRKAMPALGDFCSLEFIQEECRRAQGMPAYENTFKQLYLNLWTEQATRWLPTDRWAACATLDPEELEGRECYAGLDLGVTGDMAALMLVFPNDSGGVDVLPRFWVPENGKWKNEPRNSELYRQWNRRGHLVFAGDSATDFDRVEADILDWNLRFPFRMLYADRAYASMLLSRLFNNYGLPVKGIAQGPVTLNEPMLHLEAMIFDRTIRHDGHPVLSWNVANAKAVKNTTGLMHLDKASPTNRIDGLSALINALAAWMATVQPSYCNESPLVLL